MQYVLVGNFGVGNIGDEALKEYFVRQFPEVEWQILSASPKAGEYPRLPLGVRSFFRPWWRTIGAIRRSNGIVFGGGSLFTDSESIKACFLWGWHALVARVFNKPVYLAFQGVGPFKTSSSRKIAVWVLKRSEFISVRDKESAQRVLEIMNRNIVQSFDPVLSLFSAVENSESIKNVLILIPRKNSGEAFKNRALDLIHQQQYQRTAILMLEPDAESEQTYATLLQNAIGISAQITPIRSLNQLRSTLSDAAFVLTERYHGAIPAIAMKIPLEIIVQTEGDKLSSLKKLLENNIRIDSLLDVVEQGEQALREALRR